VFNGTCKLAQTQQVVCLLLVEVWTGLSLFKQQNLSNNSSYLGNLGLNNLMFVFSFFFEKQTPTFWWIKLTKCENWFVFLTIWSFFEKESFKI